MFLASGRRWSLALVLRNTQVYPAGFRVSVNVPRLALHSSVAFAVPEPVPLVGGVLVFSQPLWMSPSGGGPWQVSVPSPPLRVSWLPSLEAPIRVSLPARAEIVSPPRPPLRLSMPVPPVIVSLPSPPSILSPRLLPVIV